jgi:hypothetical protein
MVTSREQQCEQRKHMMKSVSVTMCLLKRGNNVLATRWSRDEVDTNKVSAIPCLGHKMMEYFLLFLLSLLLFLPMWTDQGVPLFHLPFLLMRTRRDFGNCWMKVLQWWVGGRAKPGFTQSAPIVTELSGCSLFLCPPSLPTVTNTEDGNCKVSEALENPQHLMQPSPKAKTTP